MKRGAKPYEEVAFEEGIGDEWEKDVGVVEVPLQGRPLRYAALFACVIALLAAGRLVFIGVARGASYRARALANLEYVQELPAPRGLIVDRFGAVLADNIPSPLAFLNTKEFIQNESLQGPTLEALDRILHLAPDEVWQEVKNADPERLGEKIPLQADMSERDLIALKSANLPTITVEEGFARHYREGPAFAELLGYVGFPNAADLRAHPEFGTGDTVGKDGIEASYDAVLRGTPGKEVSLRDAKGNVLETREAEPPQIGGTLRLTVDAEFQSYFYDRLSTWLRILGRQVGIGIAMDPRDGEILALVQVPSFDPNVMSSPGKNDEKRAILTSPAEPLFNRAISGLYSPGSTVKPLVGIAALKEGVIDPQKEIFSPGYLDIPNPFDPSKPTRYRDWRYQGWVNLAAAIAQSSDVYFYEVGGGTEGQKGLGIERLRAWWEKFGLGSRTGIDLPGEAKGFLPSIDWKEQATHRPWLLGDTYNVSIGQGDLLITPIELLTYIAGIASDGVLHGPVLAADGAVHPRVLADLSSLAPQIQEVVKGMRETITSPLGTITQLADLPFTVAAKTGSAQVYNNTKVNALFTGYAPMDHPQIVVLVLVENAKQGSLNAIPIGKDVLQWYWDHRISPAATSSAEAAAATSSAPGL